VSDRYRIFGIELSADPVRAFLSALVEKHAGEWGNKPMFHERAGGLAGVRS
jgi:hypothetical protein